ncbi:hypothetical protein QY895_10360 [Latilactobacillus sakei]
MLRIRLKPRQHSILPLQVKATLEVTVPARISFGTDVLGHSSGEATRTVAINEIQLAQKSVADTGTAEGQR